MLYLGSNDSKIANFNVTKMFEDFFINLYKANNMWESITTEDIEDLITGHEMVVVSLDESIMLSQLGNYYLDIIRKLLKRNKVHVRFFMYDYEELPSALSWILDKYSDFVQVLSDRDDPFDLFFNYTFPTILAE